MCLCTIICLKISRCRETIEGGSVKAKEVLNELDLIYDRDDIKALQYICAVVSFRAAHLVSICKCCGATFFYFNIIHLSWIIFFSLSKIRHWIPVGTHGQTHGLHCCRWFCVQEASAFEGPSQTLHC